MPDAAPALSSAETPDTTEGGLLDGRLKYRQFATGHRSGFEPVLLAASVPAAAGAHVLEAGTGAGAGLLCLGARVAGLTGTGLEIAPDLARLANENFRINGFSTFSCTNADVAQAGFSAVFDHAFANPPWYDAASTQSHDRPRALAHHARPGLLEDWIRAIAGYLRPRASLTLILPAASYSAATASLREQKFGAIQLLPLWPRAGLPAKRVIIAARLRAKGPDTILPGLILHDAAGITPAAQAILRDGLPTALAR